MGIQTFSVVSKEGTRELHLHYDVLIAVGYGGRDQEKVKAKLVESAAKGKKVPSKTPINYPCSVNLLVRSEKIQVVGKKTKGEAEFILVLKEGQTLLDLYEERVPYYEKYAQIVIEEDGLDVEGTLEVLVAALKDAGIGKNA